MAIKLANTFGLLLTVIGALLLYWSSVTKNPALFTSFAGPDEPLDAKTAERYRWCAGAGFLLIATGTLVQIVPIWVIYL
jgi:hypothetical protein